MKDVYQIANGHTTLEAVCGIRPDSAAQDLSAQQLRNIEKRQRSGVQLFLGLGGFVVFLLVLYFLAGVLGISDSFVLLIAFLAPIILLSGGGIANK